MTDVSYGRTGLSPVAERLRVAREGAGLTLDQASAASSLIRSYLAALEDGRRGPLPAEVERLSQAYGVDLTDLLPERRRATVDAARGRMSIDDTSRRVRDVRDDQQVYAACLFLLYTVRGAQPGEPIPLRSSDVELLMSVLGEDTAMIEQRLVTLMGCTVPEASLLRRVLLRHRAVTAAVGAAAALTMVTVIAPGSDEGTALAGADASHAVVQEDGQHLA